MAPCTGLSIAASNDDLHQALFFLSAKKRASTKQEDWLIYDELVKPIIDDRQGVVELLLEKGSRVIKQGHALQTLIRRMDWSSVAELLLSLGARACDRNAHGDTAAHLAFVNGAPDCAINHLLAKHLGDTRKNVGNDDGLTLLHIASTRWSLSFLQTMVDRGVKDINCQVKLRSDVKYAGYSPLHFAVRFDQHKNADLLLRNGASVYSKDRRGTTPLHLALYRADQKMIDLLLAHDQRNENCVNDFGVTHLMAACASSLPDIAEKFLHERPMACGFVNARVRYVADHPYGGYSPIHFATKFGNFEAAKVLLGYGASSDCRTLDGWTPKTFARRRKGHDMLQLLKRQRANLSNVE